MQAGFTCYEAGLVQSKNVISVAIENIFNLTISIVLFSLVGAVKKRTAEKNSRLMPAVLLRF